MLARLFLLFLVVPLVELALLIRVGQAIGFWPTVAIVAGTAFAGSFLARREGLAAWTRIQSALAGGRVPGAELVDGLIILVAGALLLTPGVLTDVVGLLGLLPPSRAVIRRLLVNRFQERVTHGETAFSFTTFGPPSPEPPIRSRTESTWEGTARDVPSYRDEEAG